MPHGSEEKKRGENENEQAFWRGRVKRVCLWVEKEQKWWCVGVFSLRENGSDKGGGSVGRIIRKGKEGRECLVR